MIHLIAFTKDKSGKFAYDFCSQHLDDVKKAKQVLLKQSTSKELSAFSLHLLKTDGSDFASVERKDPYFADTRVITNVNDFLHHIRESFELLDIEDVASYLLKKYDLKSFALQKVLYYLYSDYLTQNHKRLFQAKFVAFEKGPVDRKIYHMNKYKREKLILSVSFDKKMLFRDDGAEIIEFIDEVYNRYGEYYNQVWVNDVSQDPQYNLTHRNQTPWSVAYAHGQDSKISDEYIEKYHHNEVLN